MNLRHLILAIALSVPGVALSAQCDKDLAKADEGIAAGPKDTVTAEDFTQAQAIVAEARTLLGAGDDVGCVAAVGQALELLDLAEAG